MTRRAQILAIVAAILLVFFPVIFGEISMVDDHDMLSVCQEPDWTLKKLFFPGNGDGLYYRPLTVATYLLDLNLVGPEPVWMHLVNVLLHLANTLLVFRIASQLMPQVDKHISNGKRALFPLGLSLIWGFHPLVTESVAWISGRTDIIAAFFILLSTSFLLRFREQHSPLALALALIAFFCGIFSKEVAIAFLPGALLLLNAPQKGAQPIATRRKLALFLGIGCLVLLLFFAMRSFAFSSNHGKLGITLKILWHNPQYGLFTVLRAFGFYIKKLFWPWPLNFAIDGVDPLYELLAFPLLGFCLFLLWNRTLLAAFFLTGVFLITPAFALSFGQIAWMPFAERYLYLPSAFTTLATGFFAAKHLPHRMAALTPKILCSGILILFAATTFHRNNTWKTNLALFEDTTITSEGNRTILLLYSSALLNAGQPGKALTVAQEAATAPQLGYNADADILRGEILFRLGRTDEALAAYTTAYQRSKKGATSALEGQVDIHTALFYRALPRSVSLGNLRQLEALSLELFDKNKNPLILYNLGKIFWAAGVKDKARNLWQEAVAQMPPNHEYRRFATKLATKG